MLLLAVLPRQIRPLFLLWRSSSRPPRLSTARIIVVIACLVLVSTCESARHNRNKHNNNNNNGDQQQMYNNNVRTFQPSPLQSSGQFDAVVRSAGKNGVVVPHQQQLGDNSEFVTKGKICIGTNGRMSVPNNRDHHYRNLKDRFTNCTYVDGNLELTWLQDENLDLSFLQYIREVTGYVLISHVDIRRIVLPRLQIIRGRTLFKISVSKEEFALMVTLSKMYSLEMPALRDVLSGSVGLFNNYNLCHMKTVNWKEIITDPKGRHVYVYNFTSPERECPKCDLSCEAGCWGEGPDNCQKFSKENCSPQCFQGRCFGSNPRECCHLFCAGGCTGPKQSDCIACRNFYDDGVCTQECPPMQIYDPITYSWKPNPRGKYAYGATCVKNCPEHLLKDSGACVRTCPANKKSINGECVPCDGPCPKTCQGDVLINSNNVDYFRGCTVIEGYIHILENSLKGYQTIFANYTFGDRNPPMHPDRLEAFSTLKEITGFIDIQASHPDFRNLSHFRNLEIIGGRSLHDYFSSLYIVKTSLESLELRSLKQINAGSVIILENRQLCYAENINWLKIRKNHAENDKSIMSNNRNHSECVRERLICDEQCSEDGCWGAEPDQCLSCTHFKLGNTCLQSCSSKPGIYRAENKRCKACHEQCGSSCHGPGADNCTTCKHFKDGPFCVPACPSTKYNHSSGECKPCHDHCVDGCTGPYAIFGLNGCNSCDKAIMNDDNKALCLHKNDPCPDGYFLETVHSQEQELKPLMGKTMCRKCHPRCKICTGYGFHKSVCQQCTKFKRGEQCEDECPTDHYPNDLTQECIPCDQECRGCSAPGTNNCFACQNLKIYENGEPANTSAFICTSMCPPEFPHRVFAQKDNSESYCSAKSDHQLLELVSQNSKFVLVGGCMVVLVIVIIVTLIGIYFRRRVEARENALKMVLTGLEDEPLRSTNIRPNLAQIRMIKEAEIRKGGVLGHGAFGIVYKGVWVPEGDSNKIPVAIKVLHEDTGANTSKEFLDEAYIMASMDHPNLLQLLAVCMTSQMMLVTQLMPLGCLLDYVRNKKDRIGPKALLTWCTQIAKGMAYLEEKRLVHRDLAARNVLVQTPACVKITDFGLAKLLDINEEEYKAAGGKMPIKWLALECIQHRIFTHKSDVWAFGVTVWELLTFGERPYDNVPARKLPELLEIGEKLPQPTICSTEVYLIMIKCWIMDAECRPGFKELADDFAKMSNDPGRYLAIPGDFQHQNFPHGDRSLRSSHPQQHNHNTTLDSSAAPIDNDLAAYHMHQPKNRAPLPTSLSCSPPPTGGARLWHANANSDGTCAPQNQHNWMQERIRFAQQQQQNQASLDHLHHNLRNNGTTSSSDGGASSLRYTADSLKYRNTADCTGGSDEYDSSAVTVRSQPQAQVGSLKLELPLDEDDYLMPSPQQTQIGSAYVDLIADRTDGNISDGIYRTYHQKPAPEDLCCTNIDNPEYLMSQDGSTIGLGICTTVPELTLGIPTISELVNSSGSTSTASNSTQASAKPFQSQRSSEEESDHEYYNDFDSRLQRELQPLHNNKGETTV